MKTGLAALFLLQNNDLFPAMTNSIRLRYHVIARKIHGAARILLLPLNTVSSVKTCLIQGVQCELYMGIRP